MHPRLLIAVCALLSASAAGPAAAQFTDRTSAAGLNRAAASWGAVLADFDGDGHLDIYTGRHTTLPTLDWNLGDGTFSTALHPQFLFGTTDRHGPLALPLDDDELPDLLITHGAAGGAGSQPNELYRNGGTGHFSLVQNAAGMAAGTARGRCAAAADVDGDGRVDVWTGNAPRAGVPNAVFRNAANLSFVDMAAAAGLDEELGTVGGMFADFDGDGDPDLLVGGEEFPRPTVLWRNDGGTFTDASGLFSPALPVVSGADWGDFDGDGDPDLAVCDGQLGLFDTFATGTKVTYFFATRHGEDGVDGITVASTADTVIASFRMLAIPDPSKVFLGPGKVNPLPTTTIPLHDGYVGAPAFQPGVDRGTFVWRTAPGGDWEIRCSTPNLNADNFDGWLQDGTAGPAVTPVQLEDGGFTPGGPRLWRNDAGAFVEVTAAVGLPDSMLNPRGVAWVDFDCDGDLDLHVVDMGTSASPNAPDALFRNDGGWFTDVAAAEGVTGSSTGLGDGAVWGDVDDDGDPDLYLLEGTGPAAFSRYGPTRFFRNDGDRGAALRLDLVGAAPGAAAVGARVEAVAGAVRVTRWVAANSWNGFQAPMRVHLGIGAAATADTLSITWPSGTVHVYPAVPAGRYRLREDTVALDVPGLPTASPAAWAVEGARPQPARGEQIFRVTRGGAPALRAAVHDVGGRRVRALDAVPPGSGLAELAWDGRDEDGRPVAPGVYFVRVTDGSRAVSHLSVRLR